MNSLKRTLAAWILTVLTAGGLFAQTEKPNIVVILADDMGYGDVQALNPDSTIPTPNLDRLAKEGVVLTDAHSPSAVCTPTRYGLLTGRYCWRTRLKRGVLGGYSPPLIQTDRPTVATLLKSQGYQTAAIGKWHLGMALPQRTENAKLERWDGDPGIDFSGIITDSPIHHGFDSYFGVSASLDMAPYVYIRNQQFTMKPSIQQPAVRFPFFVRKGPRSEDFVIAQALDRLTAEAVKFITEDASADKPFFLYFPLTAPHKPTQPHTRFRGKSQLGLYGDFVMQVDWTVGRILKALETAKVADNTMVIYTSDNGSYMFANKGPTVKDHVDDPKIQSYRADRHRANGPLRGTKADVWEAGHRVPFLARWPGKIKPGSKSATTVCLTDLYATCAEIVGAKLKPEVAQDSYSMVAALKGEKTPRGAPVIHHSVNGTFAIRQGKWKLILGNGSGGREQPRGKPFGEPFQLYDLEADLSESNDLAAKHPDVVKSLQETFEKIRASDKSAR